MRGDGLDGADAVLHPRLPPLPVDEDLLRVRGCRGGGGRGGRGRALRRCGLYRGTGRGFLLLLHVLPSVFNEFPLRNHDGDIS